MSLLGSTTSRGLLAEISVAQYLAAQGFIIQAQNYRCRGGEIDIIAMKDELMVFVEVKMRLHFFACSHEIISSSKQRKCSLAAQHYIVTNQISQKICRFDVAFVSSEQGGNITYIPNAFQHPSDDHTW